MTRRRRIFGILNLVEMNEDIIPNRSINEKLVSMFNVVTIFFKYIFEEVFY